MKRRSTLTSMASAAFLSACGAPRWDTARYDQFPLNWRRAERGAALIRVIAIVPGGGALSDAVGVELAKRGFVIIEPASTVGMVTGVDFKAVAEHPIPARRNPVEMWKLRNQLHARGVDAFMIVRVHDFAPRPYLGRLFWQQAELEIHSTTEENATSNGAIAGTFWANLRHDRAQTPPEAAAEMVKNLARGPGAI